MTRRQLARERRAYNRLRRLWWEALREYRWPLAGSDGAYARDEMELPKCFKWRHL